MDSAFAPYTWRQNNNAAAKQIFLIALLFDLGLGKDSTFFWYFDKNIVPMRCHRVPIRCHHIALLSQQAIALRHFCCHLAIIGFLYHFIVANGECFNYFL